MHGLLIVLRDAAIFVVAAILVLLFLSLLGAISQSTSFFATLPVILLRPFLPVLSRLGLNVLDWYSPNVWPARGGIEASFRSVQSALDYLVNRIVDEAKLQAAPLTEVERKILYFSEADPALHDMLKMNAEFDPNWNVEIYQEKIAGLSRRITARDQRQDHAAQAAWDDAVLKLSESDYYLLALMGSQPAATSNLRPHPDILRLWITAFGIVFGGIALTVIGSWLLRQEFFLHWLGRP